MEFTWGLWDLKLTVAEIYPRDGGTPQALCVGGSGSFPGSKFDLTAINAALTGLYMPLWYSQAFLRWLPSWPL